MLTALLLAAGIAQAAPPVGPNVGQVREGPTGAVVVGAGQAAEIVDPPYRLSDRPAWGRPPEPCTVVAGDGNVLYQPSGCVTIREGVGNRINGQVIPPWTTVCFDINKHPKPCRHGIFDRAPTVHLPHLPFGG